MKDLQPDLSAALFLLLRFVLKFNRWFHVVRNDRKKRERKAEIAAQIIIYLLKITVKRFSFSLADV